MATAREVKRRMRSVKNIMQVTRALEATSASKVRRATQAVMASRAYTDKAYQILVNLASTAQPGTALHPMLDAKKEPAGNVTIILVTADRGLAGAYNSNILRVARQFAHKLGVKVRWVAVGKKGRDLLLRSREEVIGEFTGMPARPTYRDIRPIVQLVTEDYLNNVTGEVYVAYTDFINTLVQSPRLLRLLPLSPTAAAQGMVDTEFLKQMPVGGDASKQQYEYEPDPAAILDEIVPKFVQMIVLQSVLESQASEHSARMVAMRNASDAAKDLIGTLQLQYNKARQTGITNEILDIVGGANAIQQAT
jgi:F-type H+-transporting ATPase subunit gamma